MRIATKTTLGFIICCLIIIPLYVFFMNFIILRFINGTTHTVNSGVAIAQGTSEIYDLLDKTNEVIQSVDRNNMRDNLNSKINGYHFQLNRILKEMKTNIQLRRQDANADTYSYGVLQTMLMQTERLQREIDLYYQDMQKWLMTPTLANQPVINITQIQKQTLALNNINSRFMMDEEKHINHFLTVTKIATSIFNIATYLSIFLVAIFILQTIVSRVNALSRTAQAIKTKQQKYVVEDRYSDELTILSMAFNSMAASLQRSMSYIKNLIKMMPNFFIVTDADLKIKDINETAFLSMGFDQQFFKNKNLLDFLPGEDKTALLNLMQPTKVYFSMKDGNELPVLLSSVKIHNYETNSLECLYFGQNISQLVAAEKRIIQSARQAGIVNITTRILHNVANLLTSINVTTSLITQKLHSIKINNLSKLRDLIAQQHESDQHLIIQSRAKHVAHYVIALSNSWNEDKAELLNDIQTMNHNIRQIGEMLNAEQKRTKDIHYLEKTSLPELVNDAIKLIFTQKENEPLIRVDNKISKKAFIDRNKLFDVLINLLNNSLDALNESDHPQKMLEISLYEQDNDHFVIKVKDNGIGILPEHLDKIFTHGFTTKEFSHGFGLHYSSLNLMEMGGSLTAYSEGINKGAVFTITLPYETVFVENA